MKITTKSGFKFEFDERLASDYRMIESINKAENSDDPNEKIAGTVETVNFLFGKDKKRLMEHLANKNDGFVPQEALKEELLSVFESVRELKNSQASQG